MHLDRRSMFLVPRLEGQFEFPHRGAFDLSQLLVVRFNLCIRQRRSQAEVRRETNLVESGANDLDLALLCAQLLELSLD